MRLFSALTGWGYQRAAKDGMIYTKMIPVVPNALQMRGILRDPSSGNIGDGCAICAVLALEIKRTALATSPSTTGRFVAIVGLVSPRSEQPLSSDRETEWGGVLWRYFFGRDSGGTKPATR